MNTYNLEVFCLCAEKRSFTAAAQALAISQPAVSFHIRSLEEQLGATLFERGGKGLSLTEAGQVAYRYARDSLQALDDLRVTLNQYQQGSLGRVAAGASINLGRYRLPATIAAFKQAHAGAEVRLVVDYGERVVRMVQEGDLDIACVVTVGRRSGLVAEPVGREPMVLVAAPDHPAAAGGRIGRAELTRIPLVASLRETRYMRSLEDRLREEGIPDPNFAAEMGDTEGIKKAVQAGLGFAFVYRMAVDLELAHGLLREVAVDGLEISGRVDLVYREGRAAPPLVAELSDAVRRHYRASGHAAVPSRLRAPGRDVRGAGKAASVTRPARRPPRP